jgi:hypothetical protein
MIYLSGPISNGDPVIQRENLERMNLKARELEARGFEVFNPADWETDGASWEEYLVRDLFWIFENRPNFYFMRNWETSRGCRLEHEAAVFLGAEIEYEKEE